jgi:Cu2+-exporting ATPase
MVAVAVLIVTCPCALSLATPVAMLTAAGTLARSGVLVRQLQALEALADVDTVVFDKTGTLTGDTPALRQTRLAPDAGMTEAQALALATCLARDSLHPLARALAAVDQELAADPAWQVDRVEEVAGAGLVAHAVHQGAPATLRLGSAVHAGVPQNGDEGQQAVLSCEQDGRVREIARFAFSEQPRPQAAQALARLRAAGVQVQLLSGDRQAAVRQVAARLGIAQAAGDCTPQDKLTALQALQAQGRRVAMVGDGLNDGPVLAGAHVSFAFGRAVALARARADFVVLGDNLELIAQTVLLARRTLAVVRQNLWWAALYNALCVPLAVAGWMPAWLAGLGMACSSLLVVLNAARLARSAAPAAEPAPRLALVPREAL